METFHYLIGHDADPIAWWQMSVRAVIVFVYAVALYRTMPRKSIGDSAVFDIVVTVIMASSLSRALTGNAPLLATLIATAGLAALYVLLSFVAQRSDAVSRVIKGRPMLLVRNGEVDQRAMRWALLGRHDLEESLRLAGVDRTEEVAEAYLERNGAISVIKRS